MSWAQCYIKLLANPIGENYTQYCLNLLFPYCEGGHLFLCLSISIPICTCWIWTLLLEESYKWRHHSRGMAQSLDSSIGTLLKVVMIPRHVEWGECRATPLHGAGNGWWGQRHPKSAIWWQRALYGVRNGCCYGCRAGAESSQGLWVLKCRKTGWRRYPGAKRQIIRCCKGWSWKGKKKISLDKNCTLTCKSRITLSVSIN